MDDIQIQRETGNETLLDFDDTEQALFDDLSLNKESQGHISRRMPRNPRPRHPVPSRQPRRQEAATQEGLDAFVNNSKMNEMDMDEEDDDEVYHEEEDPNEQQFGGGGMGGEAYETASAGYKSVDEEKADLLNRLQRYKKKGHAVSRSMSAYSSLSEIRTEYNRIKYSIDAESAIKTARKVLIAGSSGVEMLNTKYNPFDIYLEGWSESIMENIEDYDGVFEELYNKYKTTISVAPEVKLLTMLGGSALMFHITNSMFKAAVPNIGAVMKQNPDLVASMMSAVQNTSVPTKPTDPTNRPVETGGRREMQGPSFDLSSLMGNVNMPPPPAMNTMPHEAPQYIPQEEEVGNMTMSDFQNMIAAEDESIDFDDDISDIVSIEGGGEIREFNVSTKKKGGRKKKSNKKEISL